MSSCHSDESSRRNPTDEMNGMLHSEDFVQHDRAKFLYSLNRFLACGYYRNDKGKVYYFPNHCLSN